MPDVRLGGAYGSINLDLAPLRQAASGVRTAFGQISQASEAARVSIVRSQEQSAAALERLKGAISLQQRQYQILKQEVAQAGQAYGEASIQAQKKQLALDRLNQSIANNQARLQTVEAELQRFNTQLNEAGSGAGVAVSRFTQMRDNLDNLGQQMTATGAVLSAGFTAPIALAGAAALKSAGDYEQAVNLFQANTGATTAQMERMRETAKALGADLSLPGASAADAGEVMLELAKAGLDVNASLAEAKGTMALAATEGLANAEAAEIAAAAYNTFQKEGLRVAQVADMLAAGSSASSASVKSLSQGLQQAGSSFAAANVPMRDLVAQMSLLANAGIQGSDAGTSLKTMLQRLQGPTDKARSEMRALGISIYDAQGNMLPMRDLVEQFTAKLGGLTQEQRDAAIVTIFGSDAQRAANIVLAGGVEQYDRMLAAVGRTGAATELAAARMKGVNGAVEGFKSALETTLLQAVEPFLPAIASLITGAAQLVGAFGNLPEPVRNAAVAFAAVLAVAGPVLLALGGLAAAAATVSAPILGAVAAVAGLTAALASGNPIAIGAAAAIGTYLAVQQWGAVVASVSAIAAQTAALVANAGAALAASGPFIVLGAAVAGAVLIYQKWKNISKDAADRMLAEAGSYQRAAAALDRYNEASDDAKVATSAQAEELRSLQEEQEADIRLRAEMAAQDRASGPEWDANTNRINARAERTRQLTAALNENLDRVARGLPILEAEATAQQQAERAVAQRTAAELAAAGDIAGALLAMRDAAGLTDEIIEKLGKDLEKAAEGGRKAFADAVGTEAGFYSERERAASDHNAEMEKLRAELAGAGSEAERKAAEERIAAAESGYREQEAKAAESYARQQAAQLAHLGQMLIDYATAQAQMAGIGPREIAQMTTRIAAEYGVQTSLVDRSFGQMTESIDAWVANGGGAVDEYVGNLTRIQQQTVDLQREVDRQIGQMTDAAREEFTSGKISLDEYVDRLRKIPREAEVAAAALKGIPARVASEIVITTTKVTVEAGRATQRRGGAIDDNTGDTPQRRALGGPVRPNTLYEVAEGGIPELLAVGGRSYLLMGGQAGQVSPANRIGAGGGDAAASIGGALAQLTSGLQNAGAGLAGATSARSYGQDELRAMFEASQAARLANAGPRDLGDRLTRGGDGARTFAPVINLHGVVVDNAQRLEELKRTIVDAASEASTAAFGHGVDRLIQGGGVR